MGVLRTGKRKEFFENARWLVLHLIFLRQHPERGEELALNVAEMEALRQETDDVSEALDTIKVCSVPSPKDNSARGRRLCQGMTR
jgi:hypothetical protein